MPASPAPADPGWDDDLAWLDRDPMTAAERQVSLDRLCEQDEGYREEEDDYGDVEPFTAEELTEIRQAAVMTIASSSTPDGRSTSSPTGPSAGPPQPAAPTPPNPPATPSEPRPLSPGRGERHPSSSLSSRNRATAWLRELAPSFR
jgi:hypothetical protein